MPSRVQVCNMALGLIGGEPIQSLTEESVSAVQCNLYLDQAIQEVCRAYPWNCCMKLKALAQESTSPDFKWGYAYSLPADYARALAAEYYDINFQIVGGKLYSDESTFNLEYIAVVDVNEMDPLCRASVVLNLARYLAFAQSNSLNLADAMEKAYDRALVRASISDSQEGTPAEVYVEQFLTARY